MSLVFPQVYPYILGGGIAPSTYRGPMPPFDTPRPSPDPPYQPIPITTTLPPSLIIPAGADRLFWRGDAFAVTVSGVDRVAGMETAADYTRTLSWFLDRYPLDQQARILQAHRDRRLTHFTLSLQDSYAAGQSLEQFVQTALRVKAAGMPFVHVQLLSKLWTPESCTWDSYARGVIEPALHALIAAQAVDHVSNWEADLIWQTQPGNMQSVIDGIAAICNAAPYPVSQWFHGSPHVAGWGPNPYDRRQWWPSQRGKLIGVLYQGRCEWPVGDRQARAMDTCVQFAEPGQEGADGHRFLWVYWEADAQDQYNELAVDEVLGELRGWENLCAQDTRPFVPSSGFGNGARYPNGWTI